MLASLVDFKKVSASEWETSKILMWQRQKIDKEAEQKRIPWLILRQLMVKWVGKDGFGQMTRKDGIVVLGKLKVEGFREMGCKRR